MAALTGLETNFGRLNRGGRDFTGQGFVVANGVAVRGGALIGLGGPDHATPGEIRPWAPAADLIFAGYLLEPILNPNDLTNQNLYTGDGTDTAINRKAVNVDPGVLEDQNVAGVTAETEVGVPVYCTTDNLADLTLTPTTPPVVIGYVTRFRATNRADVKFVGLFDQLAALQDFDMLEAYIDLGQINAAGRVARLTAPYAGFILATRFCVQEPLEPAGALDLHPRTPSGLTTGGVVTVSSAHAFASLQSGTAVTNNPNSRFNRLDELGVDAENMSTLNPTAGTGTFYFLVQKKASG